MEPISHRPYMPGYGIRRADEGGGLLPWTWATRRLTRAHDYWVATIGETGAAHVTPVWGAWLDDEIWFSASRSSRKARNIRARAAVTITTDDAHQPVIVEGIAREITDRAAVEAFASAINRKYESTYGAEFFVENFTCAITPRVVFGLDSADFTGTPTRWTFA
jgi:nitroimidazol reductase NimA-like FMN-containing flavoprotein (pyridoxamine 5'-phosphate oxidase superfamily)